MKKFKYLVFFAIVFILTLCVFSDSSVNSIVVNSKQFYQGNNKKVGHRELAIASALSYVGPPISCRKLDGSLKSDCKFTGYLDIVEYVNKTMNLNNYATVEEMNDWDIVDYESRVTSLSRTNRLFYAFTMEKGDNIVIVFRGTDFYDIFEWIQDFEGGIRDINAQESYAEEYVLKIARKYKDKHIYITGHSLGGYLTQIGASALEKAIENGKTGSTDWNGWNLFNKYNINSYTNNGSFSEYKDIKFEQAVYYDGIGIDVFSSSSLGSPNNSQDKKISVLKKLGQDKNSFGESKLIAYNVRGDIVSALGLHFGEVRETKAPLDTVASYKRLFDKLDFNVTSSQKANNVSILLKFEKWLFNFFAEKNITKVNVLDIYSEYDVGSNIASVVLAHKPDGFMCSLDGNDSEVKVKIVEKKLVSSVPYLGDILSKSIASEVFTNKQTTLVATTFNACATKYVWHVCDLNGKNCVDSSMTNNNEFTITNKNTQKLISVTAYYDDSYTKKQLETVTTGGTTSYHYKDVGTYKYKSGQVTSDAVKIVYDTTAPTCSFETSNPTTVSRVCVKKGFLGLVCNKWDDTKTIKLSCTDSLSGISATGNSFEFSLSDNNKLLILPILRLSNLKSSVKNNKLTVSIDVKRLRTASNTPKLNFKGTIKDKAGNTFKNISLSIK